jgi:hypothetical protein
MFPSVFFDNTRRSDSQFVFLISWFVTFSFLWLDHIRVDLDNLQMALQIAAHVLQEPLQLPKVAHVNPWPHALWSIVSWVTASCFLDSSIALANWKPFLHKHFVSSLKYSRAKLFLLHRSNIAESDVSFFSLVGPGSTSCNACTAGKYAVEGKDAAIVFEKKNLHLLTALVAKIYSQRNEMQWLEEMLEESETVLIACFQG